MLWRSVDVDHDDSSSLWTVVYPHVTAQSEVGGAATVADRTGDTSARWRMDSWTPAWHRWWYCRWSWRASVRRASKDTTASWQVECQVERQEASDSSSGAGIEDCFRTECKWSLYLFLCRYRNDYRRSALHRKAFLANDSQACGLHALSNAVAFLWWGPQCWSKLITRWLMLSFRQNAPVWRTDTGGGAIEALRHVPPVLGPGCTMQRANTGQKTTGQKTTEQKTTKNANPGQKTTQTKDHTDKRPPSWFFSGEILSQAGEKWQKWRCLLL